MRYIRSIIQSILFSIWQFNLPLIPVRISKGHKKHQKHWQGFVLVFFLGLSLIGVTSNTYAQAQRAGDPFTIVVIPDSQTATDYRRTNHTTEFNRLKDKIQWIIDNKDEQMIDMVVHVGDIIQSGHSNTTTSTAQAQWDKAIEAFYPLKGVVPVIFARGNHDDTPGYLQYFGPTFHMQANGSSYLGHAGTGLYDHDSDTLAVKAILGGRETLFVTLSCAPSDIEQDYYETLLQQNPNLPVVMVSHIITSPGILSTGGTKHVTSSYVDFPACDPNEIGGSEVNVWNDLVVPHADQTFLALSGHFDSEGFKALQDVNGQDIIDSMQDFQNQNAGDGYIILLRFSPEHKLVEIDTYSPPKNTWKEEEGQSSLTALFDFSDRFGDISMATPVEDPTWTGPYPEEVKIFFKEGARDLDTAPGYEFFTDSNNVLLYLNAINERSNVLTTNWELEGCPEDSISTCDSTNAWSLLDSGQQAAIAHAFPLDLMTFVANNTIDQDFLLRLNMWDVSDPSTIYTDEAYFSFKVPLAEITSPLDEEVTTPNTVIDLVGTAHLSYRVEYAFAPAPSMHLPSGGFGPLVFTDGLTLPSGGKPVTNGILATLDISQALSAAASWASNLIQIRIYEDPSGLNNERLAVERTIYIENDPSTPVREMLPSSFFALTGDSLAEFKIVDLDQDGMLEFFVHPTSNSKELYHREIGSAQPASIFELNTATSIRNVVPANLDMDSDLELVAISLNTWEAFESDGTRLNSWTVTDWNDLDDSLRQPNESGERLVGSSAEAIDIDGDGLMEILVTSGRDHETPEQIYISLLDSDGSTIHEYSYDTTAVSLNIDRKIHLIDIEGDGEKEIVFIVEDDGQDILVILDLSLTEKYPPFPVRDSVLSATHDFDGDNIQELIIWGSTNIYKIDGSKYNYYFPPLIDTIPLLRLPNILAVEDLDQDGSAEVVLEFYHNYENDGSATGPAMIGVTDTIGRLKNGWDSNSVLYHRFGDHLGLGNIANVKIKDLDGDGFKEIIVRGTPAEDSKTPILMAGTAGEMFQIFNHDGSLWYGGWKRHFPFGYILKDFQITDLEGDGVLELIGLGVDPHDESIKLITLKPQQDGIQNSPPELAPIGYKEIQSGEVLSFTISATDPDGDILMYSANPLPPGASFDPNTQTFFWATTPAQYGNFKVTFMVDDQKGTFYSNSTDSEEINISVLPNSRPSVNVTSSVSVDEGELLSVPVRGSDINGDQLTLSGSPLPQGSYFVPLGDVTLDGNVNTTDSLYIQYYAVGAYRLSETQLAVADVNEDGLVNTTDSRFIQQISVGSIVHNKYRFVWRPTYAQSGVYSIVFDASDGQLSATDKLTTVTVNDSLLEKHWLETESADSIISPMQTEVDTEGSNYQYIYAPNGTQNSTGSPGSVMATYSVSVDKPGNYALWGRVIAPDGNNDSFWIQIDNGQDNLWDVQQGASWHWAKVKHRGSGFVSFNLTSGTHTIKVKLREDGTKIDKLLLTNDMNFTPTSFGADAEN